MKKRAKKRLVNTSTCTAGRRRPMICCWKVRNADKSVTAIRISMRWRARLHLITKNHFFLCVSDTQSRCIDMHPTWELLLFLLTFLVWTPSVESTLLANEARHWKRQLWDREKVQEKVQRSCKHQSRAWTGSFALQNGCKGPQQSRDRSVQSAVWRTVSNDRTPQRTDPARLECR